MRWTALVPTPCPKTRKATPNRLPRVRQRRSRRSGSIPLQLHGGGRGGLWARALSYGLRGRCTREGPELVCLLETCGEVERDDVLHRERPRPARVAGTDGPPGDGGWRRACALDVHGRRREQLAHRHGWRGRIGWGWGKRSKVRGTWRDRREEHASLLDSDMGRCME